MKRTCTGRERRLGGRWRGLLWYERDSGPRPPVRSLATDQTLGLFPAKMGRTIQGIVCACVCRFLVVVARDEREPRLPLLEVLEGRVAQRGVNVIAAIHRAAEWMRS